MWKEQPEEPHSSRVLSYLSVTTALSHWLGAAVGNMALTQNPTQTW